MSSKVVPEDEQPDVLAACRTPGAFPVEIASQKIELLLSGLNAAFQHVLHEQVAGAAIPQRLVIARHEQGIDSVLQKPVVKGNGPSIEQQTIQQERALFRCTLGQRAVKPVNAWIQIRRFSIL